MPSIIGDPAGIERVAYELCEDQAKRGVVYFEARFSPHFMANTTQSSVMEHKTYHGCGEVDPDMVVQSVLKGLSRGERAFKVQARAILCCISAHKHWSQEVLDLALKYRDQGVVAIDIAGSAHSGALEEYEVENVTVFEQAKKANMHRTAHAGESGTWRSVERALNQLHAERIGHGYHALDNPPFYAEIRHKHIHFETCPTSSRCTGAVTVDWPQHPIAKLAADNVNFGISSDDPTCFDAYVDDEVLVAHEKIGLSVKQLAQCYAPTCTCPYPPNNHFLQQLNAAKSCFLPDAERDVLVNQVSKAIHKHMEN